jgi:hypothetical protein
MSLSILTNYIRTEIASVDRQATVLKAAQAMRARRIWNGTHNSPFSVFKEDKDTGEVTFVQKELSHFVTVHLDVRESILNGRGALWTLLL